MHKRYAMAKSVLDDQLFALVPPSSLSWGHAIAHFIHFMSLRSLSKADKYPIKITSLFRLAIAESGRANAIRKLNPITISSRYARQILNKLRPHIRKPVRQQTTADHTHRLLYSMFSTCKLLVGWLWRWWSANDCVHTRILSFLPICPKSQFSK